MDADFLSFADVLGGEAEAPKTDASGSKASKSRKDKSSSSSRAPGNKRKRTLSHSDEDIAATPWVTKVDWNPRRKLASEQLHAEVIAFYEYLRPTRGEHALRERIISDIGNALRFKFRDAKVEPFGSYNTKLYLPSGDIDLVMVCPSLVGSQKSIKSVLWAIATRLQKERLMKDPTVIAGAKVPIVKGTSVMGNYNIDISVNQYNGVKAAPMVTSLMESVGIRAARALIMVVKTLLMQRGLHEVYSGGLGSYSVICLVISFLQLHPLIQKGEIEPADNLGVLLIEFLELYGRHFNYDVVGVSLAGRGSYFDKIRRGWINERSPYLLSIEDPQDPSNDISGGSREILKVRQAFSGAYDMITAAVCQRAIALDRRRPNEDECSQSLLGSIVTAPTEALQARYNNRKLVDDADQQIPEPPPKKPKREWKSPSPPRAVSNPESAAAPAYALGQAGDEEDVKPSMSASGLHPPALDGSQAQPVASSSRVKTEPTELSGLNGIEDADIDVKPDIKPSIKKEEDDLDVKPRVKTEDSEEESRYGIKGKGTSKQNKHKGRRESSEDSSPSSDESSASGSESDSSSSSDSEGPGSKDKKSKAKGHSNDSSSDSDSGSSSVSSDSGEDVAKDLILNTSRAEKQRSGGRVVDEASNGKGDLPATTSTSSQPPKPLRRTSSNSKATRNAYWAAKGVKQETDYLTAYRVNYN